MATSNVSVSGAVSGIDTASLIDQLMQVEGQSQTALKTKQTTAQTAADAYTALIAQLSTFQSAAATVSKTSSWQGSTATSSSTAVTATAKGNAQGTLTFDVTAVAKAHTLISASSVASTGTVVASGGSLTVTNADGSTKGMINVGNGSLSDVVAGINGSDLGLRAAAVQTSPGNYRLQVTSSTAGVSSQFGLTGLTGFTGGTNGTNVLAQAQDAKLTIGDPLTTGYTVSSSNNTFADLVPGLSFTVSKVESGVTVNSALDGTAVATNIQAMVDAANKALSAISTQTAYDTTKKTGAALYGENGLKSLSQSILSAVSGAGAAGVSVTKDGTLSFDQAAFLKSFKADPTATAAAFGAKSSFTPNTGVLGKAALLASQTGTRSGTYAVNVTQAAAKERWTAAPNQASMVGKTVVVTQGSLTASYTMGAGDTLADAASAINTKAAAAGIKASAVVNSGGKIEFTASDAGTAEAFSVTYDGAAGSKDQAGLDVAGTIDGKAATGNGNILSAKDKTSGAFGLAISADFSAADVSASGGAVGSISYTPGVAQKLSSLISDATGTDGSVTKAKQSRLDAVKDFQDQIDAWDLRLEQRRESLTKQFTAMETAISNLKSQSSSITSLLSSSSSS
jgi:flagellar hook-associated protein 2